MKTKQLVEVFSALQGLVAAAELSPKVGRKLSRAIGIMKPEVILYEEARQTVFKNYGKDGQIKPEHMAQAEQEIKDLLEADVVITLPDDATVTLDELGDKPIAGIGAYLAALDGVVVVK